jgi:hypothetical protein
MWGILGKDHSSVSRISVSDMNIIPEGPAVVSEDEIVRITGFNDSDVIEEKQKATIMQQQAAKTYNVLLPCLHNGTALVPKVPIVYPLDAEGHYYDLLERTAIFRNQPFHYYAGYNGPWIENYFIDAFIGKQLSFFNGMIPLFVQWVDVMVAGDWAKVVKLMVEILRPDVLYFTVCQSDEGLREISIQHPNIFTISAGGFGHVAIPLIKGEDTFAPLPATFELSVIFCGNLKQHSRPEAMKNFESSLVKFKQPYKISSYSGNWPQELRSTRFPLAPRGYGRSSYRFTEIVHSGRCPIYIYDDFAWMPYLGTNASIEKYGFMVRNSDSRGIDEIVARIANMSDSEYRSMADNAASFRHLFTYKGVIDQIQMFIEDPLGPRGGLLRCTRVPDSTHGYR